MKKILSFLIQHKHGIVLSLVIILAFSLRFYNFENRWGLAHDQARDAIVVRYALENNLIPLIGPFSASGPFVFGPHWYWIFIFVTALYPGSVVTPWVFQGLLYTLIVFLTYLLGKEVGGKNFGLFAALLSAVSTAQIAQSLNLSYSSFVGFLSVLTLYILTLFLKRRKPILIFLVGFLIALSVNIHFQAVGMLLLIPIIYIVGKLKPKELLGFFIGLFIPFIPLIIFDINSNFYESSNIINYLLGRQENINLPKRWLTYVVETWPVLWARVVGGEMLLGIATGVLLFLVSLVSIIKKEINKNLLIIILFFSANFVLLRYFKGQIFDSFITFLHPAIIVLSAWLILRLFKINKFFGLFLASLLLFGSLSVTYREMIVSYNSAPERAESWTKTLMEKYPEEKFAIYDFEHRYTSLSLSLALFLQTENRISDDGLKVGVSIATPGARLKYERYPSIAGNEGGYQLFYLDDYQRGELEDEDWRLVNPSLVYNSIQNWYK